MTSTYFDFPYRIDGRGRTAETDRPGHVRDLIYQVLFTAPGERVNRPDFGCGITQLVFEPNSDALAAATQFLVRGALTRWLDGVIVVADVAIANNEGALTITVSYADLADGQQQQATFHTPGGSP
jgi:phage baseplate assembly protein W